MLNPEDFVHLHVHTEYSTLDGINKVSELPAYVESIGMNAVAMTDHGNISGAFKFVKECEKKKIKPIVGMEAYYTVNDRKIKEVDDLEESYYHLVLLADGDVGLHNLIKLSSFAFIDGFYRKPRVDDQLLIEHSEGIYATSACLGSRSSQLILKGRKQEALRLIEHHAEIFKDRFFIEIQLHADEEQQQVNAVLIELASRKNLPLVLTADCHYQQEDHKIIHEQALCMQTRDVMSNPKRFSFGEIDVHMASTRWMYDKAVSMNIPIEALTNTRALAQSLGSNYFTDKRNKYPKFPDCPNSTSSWHYLEKLAKTLLMEKFGGKRPPIEYIERINYELKTIKKMGFSDYMLIDWDIVNGANSIDVMVGPGRGSAAGSLVSYALGITKIDPIKHNLLFERFLNYGRAAKPMIFPKEKACSTCGTTGHHHH